eukprot:bmy_07001T0
MFLPFMHQLGPLIILLRKGLKCVSTGEKVKKICTPWFLKIEGRLHTDISYPASFMGVINIDKSVVHQIVPEEAKYRFCEVRKIYVGTIQMDIFWIDLDLGQIN